MTDIEIVGIAYAYMKRKRTKDRGQWVHPLNLKRLSVGQFHCLYGNLRRFPDKFFNYYRMSIASFDQLLDLLRSNIQKRDTPFRKAITVEERLTITLRYLATGTHFSTIQYQFRMGRSTISFIVRETCISIWKVLQPIEMKEPTQERWLELADEFYARTQFPNCIGAVDGKHIRLMCPRGSRSEFSNYKKFFSLVLMAIADANYCFTYVDIGAYGREEDCNVFRQSSLGEKMYANTLNIPDAKPLPNTNEPNLPFVLVGDEAFGLHSHLQRPYPNRGLSEKQRIFNYRLTRARRYVECTFGILANKWGVFHTSILVQPEFAVDIIKAATVLHNYVRRRDGYKFEDSLSCSLDDIQPRGTGYRSQAQEVRDIFANYFISPEGEIP